ncbi:MAG: hypothetical protein F4Z08_08845 [Chloroflexi bacterium]|nr:hypothetical protein [Chloroflexota bacterium]
MCEVEWAEWAVRVLVGLGLFMQLVGGWFAFVAYADENLVPTGSRDASNRIHGLALSWLIVKWSDDSRERWPLRLTHRYFGGRTRPDADAPWHNGGCHTAAKGARFISYVFAGMAFYIAFLFEIPLVRLIQ